MWNPFKKQPRRKHFEPDSLPLLEPESSRQVPILALAWEQREPWGVMQVLFNSDNLILRRFLIDPGTTFPIHRHEYANEVLFVADGEIKIVEHRPEGNLEFVRVTGDVHTFQAMLWHQVIALHGAILTFQHVPKNHMVRANIAYVEEWKPNRQFIGRG